eukprot:65412-Alexandrium_andersonii.AAC.1
MGDRGGPGSRNQHDLQSAVRQSAVRAIFAHWRARSQLIDKCKIDFSAPQAPTSPSAGQLSAAAPPQSASGLTR